MASASNNEYGNDGGARSASSSAMNLFEKYSTLNRGIDEARNEMKAARLKIEEIKESIGRTQLERDSLRQETSTANNEADQFHLQVDEANESLFQMHGEHSRVLMDKERARRELDGVKRFVEENRRQFLDQSREFRASCKRVRLRASALGLEYAPLRAFATVLTDPSSPKNKKGSPRSVLPSDFQESSDGFQRPALDAGGKAASCDANGSDCDPTTWNTDPRDEEMIEALENYKSEYDLHKQVQDSLDKIKLLHKKEMDQATSRSQRKEQLEAQLNRIKKDNDEMESQIAELEQQTVETKELGQAFEKDVKTRRQEIAQRRFEAGVTSTTQPRKQQGVGGGANSAAGTTGTANNPYAKRNRTSDNGHTRSSLHRNAAASTTRPTSTAATARAQPPRSRPSRSSYLEEQHPHRAGRIRVDRQFTSNLEIFAGSATEYLQQNHEDPPTAAPQRHLPSEIQSILDDDDSDDDLLEFVPFSKRG